MTIERIHTELRTCACGCAQVFPVYTGLLAYQPERQVAFRVAHLFHGDPHLWILFGSGPWTAHDAGGCWVTLHTWVSEGKVIGRIEEPDESPFSDTDAFNEHRLSRGEVLAQKGAMDWAIARRDELVQLHEPTRNFLRREIGA